MHPGAKGAKAHNSEVFSLCKLVLIAGKNLVDRFLGVAF
jgi:hypothetical protein